MSCYCSSFVGVATLAIKTKQNVHCVLEIMISHSNNKLDRCISLHHAIADETHCLQLQQITEFTDTELIRGKNVFIKPKLFYYHVRSSF